MSEVRIVDPTTGGEKGQKDARFDLIPQEAIWMLAEAYGRGAEKYSKWIPISHDTSCSELVGLCSCESITSLQNATLIGDMLQKDSASPATTSSTPKQSEQSVTQTGSHTSGESVEHATTETSSNGILNTLRNSVRTTASGSARTKYVFGLGTMNTENGTMFKTERNVHHVNGVLPHSDSPGKTTSLSAPSAKRWQNGASTSTTITSPDCSGGSSAEGATKVLDSSEILRRLYDEHSSTCRITKAPKRIVNGVIELELDRNWERGYNWSLSFGALQRHLWQFWNGEDIDEETGTPHIVSVLWHASALATFQARGKGNDDRPEYLGPMDRFTT